MIGRVATDTQGAVQPVPVLFGHKVRFVTGLPEMLSKLCQTKGTGNPSSTKFNLVLETGKKNPSKVFVVTVVPAGTAAAVGSKVVTKQEFPRVLPLIGSGVVAVYEKKMSTLKPTVGHWPL